MTFLLWAWLVVGVLWLGVFTSWRTFELRDLAEYDRGQDKDLQTVKNIESVQRLRWLSPVWPAVIVWMIVRPIIRRIKTRRDWIRKGLREVTLIKQEGRGSEDREPQTPSGVYPGRNLDNTRRFR